LLRDDDRTKQAAETEFVREVSGELAIADDGEGGQSNTGTCRIDQVLTTRVTKHTTRVAVLANQRLDHPITG
jgi:hypothetical protein